VTLQGPSARAVAPAAALDEAALQQTLRRGAAGVRRAVEGGILQPAAARRPHCLHALLQAGVRCTISTDDPLVFANTLNGEYAALTAEAGFTRGELAQLACNGWAVADVPVAMRAAMLAENERTLRG
jgi:hypothetical protein